MKFVVRAIPNRVTGPLMPQEHYIDLTGLSGNQREAVHTELEKQGFLVQDIWLDDAQAVLMHHKIRAELEKEGNE